MSWRWLIVMIGLVGCSAKPSVTGQASWYGPGFAGHSTASGDTFRPSRRTAAHKTLPFGTVLKVTHTASGRSVRVVINDRGPFIAGRVLDLSKGAARRIGMLDEGVARVTFRIVGCKDRYNRCPN